MLYVVATFLFLKDILIRTEDPLEPVCSPVYSLGGMSGTSSVLDNAYVQARSLVPLIARLAEVETSVYRLAVQIRRTVRRVNALEKVFIP